MKFASFVSSHIWRHYMLGFAGRINFFLINMSIEDSYFFMHHRIFSTSKVLQHDVAAVSFNNIFIVIIIPKTSEN